MSLIQRRVCKPAAAGGAVTVTGGTITTITGYKVHKFTASGNLVVSGGQVTVEYLVVAGGGCAASGGGGAGGMLEGTITLDPGTYAVSIGAGGAFTGSNGGDSSIAALIVALGGGFGGSDAGSQNGGNGGSGGGGSGSGSGGAATSGQGSNGGAGRLDSYTTPHHSAVEYTYTGGGGGGKNGAGESADGAGQGVGGAGKSNSITGTAVTYAKGGSSWNVAQEAKIDNSGNGGNGWVTPNANRQGSSGVVIVRYAA